MSEKYKIHNQECLYFITSTVIDWIDVFTRNEYRDILVDSLKFCQREKGLEIYAWVIMSNHLHLVIGSDGSNPIENIVRDFKKFTSVTLSRAIQDNPAESRKEWMLKKLRQKAFVSNKHELYRFWEEGYHPIELNNNDILMQKINYIHKNPVRAGWVYKPEDYVYSSAAAYAGLPERLLEVIIVG